MADPLQLDLSDEQRKELEILRDRGKPAYIRERAAALLMIADGMSASEVARRGLLKPRHYTTICEWVHRYKAEGIQGLYMRAGRGRKPAFSP